MANQFTAEVDRQHKAILAYLSLAQSLYTLQPCKFYLRRHPFAVLPMSEEDHIRNMCEMYFNRCYEFKERLKRCRNAVDATIEGTINAGPDGGLQRQGSPRLERYSRQRLPPFLS
ncbi:hypothetical protein HME9302_02072 [Alteripontixanthobacter maritimus]|uniref:Uncharacterized protein n=1 Tax=Alteripontixanthobacter maritimus TaxID=2161824 RepID=A0A369QC90_9SPHN|nr:hypothetical protein HME9302_02072 [Alteripontixanthobacter maritimus]